jgi:hypothetical protein
VISASKLLVPFWDPQIGKGGMIYPCPLITIVPARETRIYSLRNIRCIRKKLDFLNSMIKNGFRLALDFWVKK